MTSQPLSSHDAAVWRTVWINDLMDQGRLEEAPTVPTVMAPSIGEGEHMLAAGSFALFDFVASGDGTYLHKSGGGMFVFGSRGLVAASGAGMAVGALARASGNSRRRRAAAAAATPQWRQTDVGQLNVSQFGFYLHTMKGIHVWSWWSLSSAELIGPAQVMLVGDSERGPIRWIISSDWAELIFTMWARARHTQHPQFLQGRWVTEGWADRVRASQHGLPPVGDGRWAKVLGSLPD